jgi:hypothetical protein
LERALLHEADGVTFPQGEAALGVEDLAVEAAGVLVAAVPAVDGRILMKNEKCKTKKKVKND